METIHSIIQQFEPVSLEESEKVKLMNRIDRKYWFHASKLETLLLHALPYYHILEINGQRIMKYETTYFDSPLDHMYMKHHNGKTNRHKIRLRNYHSTQSSFLEIKLKTNKKRTIKKRVESQVQIELAENELDFIQSNSPYVNVPLQPTLQSSFQRISLISKAGTDRCTIDIQPEFNNENGSAGFQDLAIFELKRGRSLKSSPIVNVLRQLKIRQRGMSKYCTGRALLDAGLKQNSFKPRLHFLKKEFNNTL